MKDNGKSWLVKVVTDLGTRLLVIVEPHLLVKDLQGAIEHDHKAAYPACGDVRCHLLSVLEYEEGRDVPSSVNSRYRVQDVLQRDGARVYAEFSDKAVRYTACQYNATTPLQIGLSPYFTPPELGHRASLTTPVEPNSQHAAFGATGLDGGHPQAYGAHVGSKRSVEAAAEHSQDRAAKRAKHDCQIEADLAAAALPQHPPIHAPLTANSHGNALALPNESPINTAAKGSTLTSGPGKGQTLKESSPGSKAQHAARHSLSAARAADNAAFESKDDRPKPLLKNDKDAAEESSNMSDLQQPEKVAAQEHRQHLPGQEHAKGSASRDGALENAGSSEAAALAKENIALARESAARYREVPTMEPASQKRSQQQKPEPESSSESEPTEKDGVTGGKHSMSSGAHKQQLLLAGQHKQQQALQSAGAKALQKFTESSSEEGSSSADEEDEPKVAPGSAAQAQQQLPPAPARQGQQQGARQTPLRENASEDEASSSDDEGSPSPDATPPAKQRIASVPAAQGQQAASQQLNGRPQDMTTEEGSSSDDESLSGSPSPDMRPPVQQTTPQQAVLGGRARAESSSGDEEVEDDEDPRSPGDGRQSNPATAQDTGLPAQQLAIQHALPNGRSQSEDSGDESSESPEPYGLGSEWRSKHVVTAEEQARAAEQQALQGARDAVKSASSSSSEESSAESGSSSEQDDRPAPALHPDLSRQPSGKAHAAQQHAPNQAAAPQNGPPSGRAQPESSSKESESASSDEEGSGYAAGDIGQRAYMGRNEVTQQAAHIASAQDRQKPVARNTRQRAKQDNDVNNHAAARTNSAPLAVVKALARDQPSSSESSSSDSEEDNTPRTGERNASEQEHEDMQVEPGVNVFKVILEAQTAKKRQSAGKQSGRQAADEGNESGKAAGAVERVAALSVQQTPAADRDADGTAGSHQRPSTPPLTDGALLGRTLRKITEEEKAQQAAKLKDEAENPFALPPEKMKDQVHMKKLLLNGLPPIVAHEQGIALNSAARMFRDAAKPAWWPLERWDKGQIDRALSVQRRIYEAAQKQWQIMQRAVEGSSKAMMPDGGHPKTRLQEGRTAGRR